MSEYEIPLHIQEEILKRVPVKSVIRFRSVSKAWKSLIDNHEFIRAHSLHCHTQPKHLLVLAEKVRETPKVVCYIDHDTFPKQRSLLTLPLSYKQLSHPILVGSSRGLVCFCDYPPTRAILWNPSIRKSIVVNVPKCSSLGFGVCPVTSEPKIIAITQAGDAPRSITTNYPCNAMVYTLTSGKWTTLPTNNLCAKPLALLCWSLAAAGFIYWQVGLSKHKTLISFDVTNEHFQVIYLPDIFPCHRLREFCLLTANDTLTMCEFRGDYTIVSMMEQKLFTKRFIVNTSSLSYIVGFRKNCIPIMEVVERDPDTNVLHKKLVVYEPNSVRKNVLEICKADRHFTVESYMETLLLLGRSDCSSN